MSIQFSPTQIDEIIELYNNKETVISIAKRYNVNIWAIYYQLKINQKIKYIPNPTCYKDYLHNEIVYLEQKLETATDKRYFIESQLRKLRFAIKTKHIVE